MNKMIMALPLLALSATAMAKDTQISVDEKCQMTIPHDLRLAKDGFWVEDQGKALMRYQDGTLLIGERSQSLSGEQRQSLDKFNGGLRASAATGVELGVSAIELASQVTSGVLADLLGAEAAEEVRLGLDEAKVRLHQQLYEQDGTWYVKSGSFDEDQDDYLGDEFEQRVESAVKKSMGNLFTQLGQAMSSGDGSFEENVQAWAADMESRANRIEEEAKAKGGDIEVKANQLCDQLLALDEQEEGFKGQFSGWVELLVSKG